MNRVLDFIFEDLRKSGLDDDYRLEEAINLIKGEPNKIIEFSSYNENDQFFDDEHLVDIYNSEEKDLLLRLEYTRNYIVSVYFNELYFIKEDKDFGEFKDLVIKLFDVKNYVDSMHNKIDIIIDSLRLDKNGKTYYKHYDLDSISDSCDKSVDEIVNEFVKFLYKDYTSLYGHDYSKLKSIAEEGSVLFRMIKIGVWED